MVKRNIEPVHLINVNDIASIAITLIFEEEDQERAMNTIYMHADGNDPKSFSCINKNVLAINLNSFSDEMNHNIRDIHTSYYASLNKLVVMDVWLPNLHAKVKEIGVENLTKEEQDLLQLVTFVMLTNKEKIKPGIMSIEPIICNYIDEFLL